MVLAVFEKRWYSTLLYGTQKTASNNSSDGRVVRAFTSGAVDLGLIPSRVKPMTLKLVLTASLLDAEH